MSMSSADAGTLKRKHSVSTQQQQQKLTFTAQQKPSSTASTPLSPTSKRARREHSPHDALAPASVMSTADMYSFPSKRASVPNGKEVVDMTSSPDNSPAKPRNGMLPKTTLNVGASTGAGTGPRRLMVKNFRPVRKVDPKAFLEQTWQKMDAALDTIFSQGKIDFSLEELYRGVENLCRQNMARDVKERLFRKCKDYVGGALKTKVKDSLARTNVDVLRATLQAWTTWHDQIQYLDWIFCYLDRAYLLPRHESLRDIAIGIFRSIIFEHAKLNPRIVDGACDLVDADRTGGDLDSAVFKKTVDMFNDMHVYTEHFEPRFLELSQEYIVKWADAESEQNSLQEYVRNARALMDREMHRADVYLLPNTTKRDLLTLLEDHLISRKEDRLTNQDDFADLLEANAIEDLELLYSLLERRKLGNKLRPGFVKWIDDEGTAIVFNEKEQENMVVQLLTLKRQLDTFWKVSFHRDAELGHGLRESFEAFMNKTKKTSASWGTDNSKTGEMIAKYVDMLLRGGAKSIPAQLSRRASTKAEVAEAEDDNEETILDEDTEVNNQLDQVLDMFRFVHGKAVFEAFYKKDLARRLLMGRSASADAERSMLSRLKTGTYLPPAGSQCLLTLTECGAGFTANLEQMFRDIELSREEMASYKMICEERGQKQALDLNVNVLSASSWPTYPTVPVIIPPQIKTAIDNFEAHYKSKHSGRKLELKHALAHCQLKAKFPKGNKELVVSSFQAIVLLLFNGKSVDEHIDYNYLKEATGLREFPIPLTAFVSE
jgi:cullin-4